MSRRTLGILASLVGSAIGACWMINLRRTRRAAAQRAARGRGRVILDNTPTAADVDAII